MRIFDNGVYRDMTEEEIAEYKAREAEIAEQLLSESIEDMKIDLATDDYKVIKCMEYFLLGKELPYNIEELHNIRQSKRDQINIFEKDV